MASGCLHPCPAWPAPPRGSAPGAHHERGGADSHIHLGWGPGTGGCRGPRCHSQGCSAHSNHKPPDGLRRRAAAGCHPGKGQKLLNKWHTGDPHGKPRGQPGALRQRAAWATPREEHLQGQPSAQGATASRNHSSQDGLPPICPSTRPSTCPFTHPSIHLPTHPLTHSTTYPPMHPPIHPSIHQTPVEHLSGAWCSAQSLCTMGEKYSL